jgi:tetratricopeptide (TPR) repeat protein
MSLDEVERLNKEVVRLYNAGRYDEAIPLAERALGIGEKALGPVHPDVAQALNNLAGLYDTKGDYAKAEPLYQRALQIWEKALGPEHPTVALALDNLADLYTAKSDIPKAIAYKERSVKVSERNITLNLATGSERQKLLYLATLSGETHTTVSLHVESAPDNLVARRLACTTVLQRKGRTLDAMMESIAAVRRRLNPQDQTLLDQLTTTRARLATLVLSRPSTTDTVQHSTTIRSLEEQVEQLEADLNRVAPGVRVENPLLRSGLALAGANARRSGEDDGILTALEASGLNLWGTKLVVLSACDTGVGAVKNGEGVYGLRRALVLAGAETQMMSLWPVSDEGTRDLMLAYYKALQAGQGRAEALRQVQLTMLASPDQRHPFYWASFIQSGEWASLDGKR